MLTLDGSSVEGDTQPVDQAFGGWVMTRRATIVAVLGLFAATSAVSAPVGEEDRRDLRCVLVAGLVGSQLDATASNETKQGIASGVAFFMGRIKGRSPTADLSSMLVAEGRGLLQNSAEMKRELVRCGGEMQVFGAE
eukprot:gene47302-64114_t